MACAGKRSREDSRSRLAVRSPLMAHPRFPAFRCTRCADHIAVKEPCLPFGVTIEVQVPPWTNFHELPLSATPKHFSLWAAVAASTSALVNGPAEARLARALERALARTSEVTAVLADMDFLRIAGWPSVGAAGLRWGREFVTSASCETGRDSQQLRGGAASSRLARAVAAMAFGPPAKRRVRSIAGSLRSGCRSVAPWPVSVVSAALRGERMPAGDACVKYRFAIVTMFHRY